MIFHLDSNKQHFFFFFDRHCLYADAACRHLKYTIKTYHDFYVHCSTLQHTLQHALQHTAATGRSITNTCKFWILQNIIIKIHTATYAYMDKSHMHTQCTHTCPQVFAVILVICIVVRGGSGK